MSPPLSISPPQGGFILRGGLILRGEFLLRVGSYSGVGLILRGGLILSIFMDGLIPRDGFVILGRGGEFRCVQLQVSHLVL